MNYVDHVMKNDTRYEVYPKALADGIASEYSSSSTYAVDDYCIYEGEVYRCKEAVTTAGAWDSTKWEKSTVIKAIGDLTKNKADKDSSIASAEQLLGSIYTPNTSPYLYRPTPADSDRERVRRVEGLSVGWNQLVKNGNFESASGWYISSGTPSVSDNVASYTASSDGNMSLTLNRAVDAIVDHKVLAIGEVWCDSNNEYRIRYPFISSKISTTASTWTAVKFIGVVSSGSTSFGIQSNSINGALCKYRNAMLIDLTVLFGSTIADYVYSLEQATEGSGVAWVKQYIDLDSYHAYSAPTIKSVEGLEAHVMRDAEENIIGNYPLDSTITLRGIGKLVDGKLVADGDYYPPSGDVTVRYGVVDLGTLVWYKSETPNNHWRFRATFTQVVKAESSTDIFNAICTKYSAVSPADTYQGITGISNNNSNNTIFIADESISDAETLASSLSGVYLVYEKATPTTSTASPYTEVQICDGNGTDEFVTDSVVPVGTVTEYTANLRRQVENIYGIPKPPSTAGTYHLTLTVADGVPSYSWVSDS